MKNKNVFPDGVFYGLTKRELFAAMAMQGMCANSDMPKTFNHETCAPVAIAFADALIAALSTEPTS